MASWFSSLRKTRDRFSTVWKNVFTASKPDAATIEELTDLLITADVPVSMVQQIQKELERPIPADETPRTVLHRILVDALGTPPPVEWQTLPEPGIILLVGINGSGKTTTAAKLAYKAKQAGCKPLLGAADTFRAAGSHQLKIWADQIGCDVVVGATGGDAAAVAYDAIDAALARHCHPVIIDTAGRMHTKEPLMRELQKMRGAIQKRLPDAPSPETWVVLDAMLGQNAVVQARQFHDMTPLTGVVVTKLDGSSKAGFLFAIRQELKLPILFAGLGEGQDDLVPFDANDFVDALLAPEDSP